jgi:hypothetical protein
MSVGQSPEGFASAIADPVIGVGPPSLFCAAE